MSVTLRIHVHPGSRREGVAGWRADGTLKVEVSAPPENGRANRAVEEVIARALGIACAGVAVVRGMSSRSKSVAIEGLTEDEVRSRIERLVSGGGASGHRGTARGDR